MTETFAALLLAHVLADFVFQTKGMAQAKAAGGLAALLLHLALVGGLSLVALRPTDAPGLMAVAGLTLAHGLIDLAKTRAPQDRFWPFAADQAAHLASLALVAATLPGLWAAGWGTGLLPAATPSLAALGAGAILATRAGGFAIGLFMRPWADVALEGLPGGGRIIGHLERGLIFLLVLAGTAEGIGFLIAAKSVLRFGAVKEESRLSEYVIIGTLASFGWAFAVTLATVALMSGLPPLGIPDLSP